jgi:hypothetical protein
MQMGSLSEESFDEFLDSIKEAGIAITNEQEVRERLAEAQRWRYALATLAANGKALGIRFLDMTAGSNRAVLAGALARFQFPESLQAAFSASLSPEH